MRVVDDIGFQAGLPIDAFLQTRIVADIVGEALADHDAAKNLIAGIGQGVREPAFAVADEVADLDRVGLVTEPCRCLPAEM